MTTQPNTKCTCPSGDGSLRWPCPKHSPAAAQEAVVWQWRCPRADTDWSDCDKSLYDELRKAIGGEAGEMNGLRYEVRALYAAPVTAAPDAEFPAFLRDVATAAELVRTGGQSKQLATRLREGVSKRQQPARRKPASTPAAPGIDRAVHTGLLQRARALFDQDREYALERGDSHHAGQCTKDIARIDVLIDASPKGGSDARDAARWRYIRRKLCLTGNGDGTCGMQAINLPRSIPGWPDPGDDVVSFCEAAIDAAMQAQASDAEVRP